MMKMKLTTHLLIMVLLGGIVSSAKEEPPKVGDEAPDFTLEDAKENAHSLKKHRDTVVFLIMGNRKIRKEDDKWGEAFQKDYRKNDKVVAYIVGDMRSVPGFIPKSFIRNQLKKKPPPVTFLLDWKGLVHQRYKTIKDKPNLYLISQDGKIVFHQKLNFKPKAYAELKNRIDALLVAADTDGTD